MSAEQDKANAEAKKQQEQQNDNNETGVIHTGKSYETEENEAFQTACDNLQVNGPPKQETGGGCGVSYGPIRGRPHGRCYAL